MGCGCQNNSKRCGGKIKTLKNLKNRVVTLYNTEKNLSLREEYKLLNEELAKHITQSAKVCPSDIVLIAIDTHIQNEYSKRNK